MNKTTESPLNGNGFSLSHIRSTTFSTTDFHAHDCYEIYYFLKGEVHYYLEDKAYSLVPGDLLIIPAGIMHRPVIINEHSFYERMVLSLSPAYCKQLLGALPHCFVDNTAMPLRICLTREDRDDFDHNIRQLLLLGNDPEGHKAKDCLCTLLLLQFQRYTKTYASQEITESEKIQEVIRYINANFTQDLTLDDLAEHFFTSKSHLLRQFKKYTNSTVHNYIVSKRIMLAKALLKEGISVSQVCTACGFHSYDGFYQAFLRHTGSCPTQSR